MLSTVTLNGEPVCMFNAEHPVPLEFTIKLERACGSARRKVAQYHLKQLAKNMKDMLPDELEEVQGDLRRLLQNK